MQYHSSTSTSTSASASAIPPTQNKLSTSSHTLTPSLNAHSPPPSSSSPSPPTPSYILRGHKSTVTALEFYNNNNSSSSSSNNNDNAFLLSGDGDGYIVIWSMASKRSVACWKAHDGGVMQIKTWDRRRSSRRWRKKKKKKKKVKKEKKGIMMEKEGNLKGVGGRMRVVVVDGEARAAAEEGGGGEEEEGGGEEEEGGGEKEDECGLRLRLPHIITHGRDHRLRVWQLTPSDLQGETLDKRLPNEEGESESGRNDNGSSLEPWLLHSLTVSSLNFCAFALCQDDGREPREEDQKEPQEKRDSQDMDEGEEEQGEEAESCQRGLIAAPDALDMGAIDFFHLPSERRVSVLKTDSTIKTGMVMALDLFRHPRTGHLTLVSAYEDGHTFVHRRQEEDHPFSAAANVKWTWIKILSNRPHTQPVLSLDVMPSREHYFTSAADAIVARTTLLEVGREKAFPDPEKAGTRGLKINNTKHAGQQALRVRTDGLIFAAAGWDSKVRVYSCKTMKEVAVLRWHKKGCTSIAFAKISGANLTCEVQGRGGGGDNPVLAPGPNGHTSALEMIKQQRSLTAQQTHWLAAGAKDGKISLWDLY